MSPPDSPRRCWGSAYQLDDLLTTMPGNREFAVRDFALLTIAGHVAAHFGDQLVFKGGFVLRHAHGILRFSSDVDSTRRDPATARLDSEAVAAAIRDASVGDIVRFDPQLPPTTDSATSLDFDDVRVDGLMLPPGAKVQVEISYREAVVDAPEPASIGAPFYEDFEVLVMTMAEMAAEKLRTLAQRSKVTDLADLAVMLRREEVGDEDIARLALDKFALVRQGVANRENRIEQRLRSMGADYDAIVPSLFPEAPSYHEAVEIVWPRIRRLIP